MSFGTVARGSNLTPCRTHWWAVSGWLPRIQGRTICCQVCKRALAPEALARRREDILVQVEQLQGSGAADRMARFLDTVGVVP